MADQDDQAALPDVASALAVNLRDERAGCIQNPQAARLRILLHPPRDPVRAEDGDRSRGDLRQIFDETRPFCAEALDFR